MRNALGVILLLAVGSAQAATVTIDFEGVVSDTGNLSFQGGPYPREGESYLEDGMQISGQSPRVIYGKDFVTATGATNDNGSAAFGWCQDPSFCGDIFPITITNQQGFSFDLMSLQASNMRIDWGGEPADLTVTGFYEGGGSISTTLDLTLDLWPTFTFDSSWSGLSSVTITGDTGPQGSWADLAMDNIVVSTVPIPAAVWLFGSGLGLLGWFRRRQSA
jgi:hypothetical protein